MQAEGLLRLKTGQVCRGLTSAKSVKNPEDNRVACSRDCPPKILLFLFFLKEKFKSTIRELITNSQFRDINNPRPAWNKP